MAAQFGCHKPAEVAFSVIPCPCDGEGCEICQHSKDGIRVHRCPSKLPTKIMAAVRSGLVFAETGALPFAGGLLDQPAWWHDAIMVVMGQRARFIKAQAKA